MLGGVCAGMGERFGVDPMILRGLFALTTIAGGTGIALYALAWWIVPGPETGAAGGEGRGWRFELRGGMATVQVVAGIGLLALSGLLLLREWGLWFGDVTVWPTVLVISGAALLWRQSQRGADAPPVVAEPATEAGARERRAVPLSQRLEAAARGRAALGAALVVGGGIVFLWLNDALRPARDVILAVVVVLVAGAVILAPWWLRLVRGLSAERAERIRSQERAEVAAHLHDSVLQTLALVQRRAGDPRAVATLARRQERELRAWLNNGGADERPGTLAAALQRAAAEVEDAHGVAIEVVTVGDRPLDERAQAVAAAAREALTNAAKFAGDAPIDLFAEMGPERVEVFVRDRGPGFEPAMVPPDRRGVRESILGRMARHGGHAAVQRGPGGAGTEVELVLDR
jgi:signal transduction histidine kinase/phage shock protein PspC (stress-responsive transcriptional regulator)